MSPAVTALVVLASIGGFRAVEAEAQEARRYESEESLEARIQTLVPLVEEARVEAEAAAAELLTFTRRAAESIVALDTFAVGQMTIIAPVPDADRGRDLFQSAWETYFAGIESASLQASTFTFQARDEPVPIFVEAETYSRHIEIEWWQMRSDAVAVVASAIAFSINRELAESAMARWIMNDPLVDHDPAELYRRLATTPSRSVRECLAGNAASCTTSLGLFEGTSIEASLAEWYTVDERRALAIAGGGVRSIGGGASAITDAAAQCLDDADVRACDAVLLVESRRDLTPLTGVVRASLVRHALGMGGDGAWARLVEARNRPIGEALEYTAGSGLDEIVATWNAWILAARPEVHASLGSRSFFALMWTVLFAAVAMRSTRWRLG